MFLATSLLLADPVDAGPSDARAHYFRVARRFFSILALLMVWMVGVDFVLGAGFTAAGVWNAVLVVLFLVLANSNALRLHVTTTGVTWVLLLSLLISRTLNVA